MNRVHLSTPAGEVAASSRYSAAQAAESPRSASRSARSPPGRDQSASHHSRHHHLSCVVGALESAEDHLPGSLRRQFEHVVDELKLVGVIGLPSLLCTGAQAAAHRAQDVAGGIGSTLVATILPQAELLRSVRLFEEERQRFFRGCAHALTTFPFVMIPFRTRNASRSALLRAQSLLPLVPCVTRALMCASKSSSSA